MKAFAELEEYVLAAGQEVKRLEAAARANDLQMRRMAEMFAGVQVWSRTRAPHIADEAAEALRQLLEALP